MENIEKEEIKRKKNKYSIDFKIKVLDMLKQGTSLHTIENKMKLDRSMVRKWRNNEDPLVSDSTLFGEPP